jgi:hypothetical protein
MLALAIRMKKSSFITTFLKFLPTDDTIGTLMEQEAEKAKQEES